MAKEHKRSNREFKKPKKVREPVAEAAATLSSKAVLERIDPKKKR
ncbi:hypothetical protein ACFOOL_05905 [Devosia honganensis]|uniref:Uncharacterized protein n=1 Tax=Devosia honganensis TaxID=1610527 RepID=A0ABV7WYC3_9HYPH|nr:hypothetical protein [Devosia sp.]